MTQDATPCDSFLVENLVKSFENENVAISYARQVPYSDANEIEVFARTTNYPEVSKVKSKADLPILGIKTFFNSDSCAMYDGEYFRNLNGFKKNLNTNEDMEFAYRAIMDWQRVSYCAQAKVYHSHNFSLKQIWHRYQAIGEFFRQNSEILEEVAKYQKAESTGMRQALRELQYLITNKPILVPKSLLTSAVKYFAFKV